ncbi:hypothetical protein KO525_10300 [Psychrosphaera sp. B3R10]|uniref:hypothetical protein n=1 Tax=unclassified Psychrosphaera TaxID=2641570 RepID=UPI001C0A3136|nr:MULTISPECIES: hypothetical protein [unclassified Psychrosphaera]MBU2883590.1 hypothetical protein [Psychrosphaera sp. I2R16]MBU2989768.1 hypothetical protein [Psychrosphaera sp. B3R10]
MNDPKVLYNEDIANIKNRQPIMTWALAVILVGIGIYLTKINFVDIEWVTRSGCLVTLLGVWSSIGGVIQERLLVSRLNIQHRLALSKAKLKLRKYNAPKEYIDKEILSIEDEFEDKLDYLKDHVRFQLGILEVSLLMAGTFIWGFGDLLFRFLLLPYIF